MVHIESNQDVELQVFESGVWSTVCHAPCLIVVPTGQTYRIDAKGARTSNPFELDDIPGDQVVLKVDAASSSTLSVSVGAAVVGSTPVVGAGSVAIGGALALGVVVVLVCPIVATFGDDFGGCAGSLFDGGARADGNTVSTSAVASVLGGSVALAITGFVLMRSHDSTHVDRAPRNLALAPLDRHGQLPLPRGATLPLLSAAF